jgi:LuxR family maltose regulon positive regulatory protein
VVRNLLVQHFGGSEAAGSVRRARAGRDGPAWGPVATALRERTVLALLASLLSLEEIGAELTVPINTVKSYVRSIYNKLGISSRRTAVLAGYEHGLIATPPAATGYPVTLSG